MKDYEEIKLNTEKELKDFFAEQEKTDSWLYICTKDLETVPLENNELNLFIDDAFETYSKFGVKVKGFADGVEESDIRSSMETTKTSVLLPFNDKIVMYPLRYTAWSHIQERSGITGGSISSLKERRRAVEMAPAIRCDCINEGLNLYKDKTLVLIRDGKVSALLSGDESDYSIMPIIRLIKIMEYELNSSYAGYCFKNAITSHELTSIVYDLHDDELEKRIYNFLSNNGCKVSKVEVKLRLTTSDVGLCAARLTPIVLIDGRSITMGKSLSVKHQGGEKAMSLFIDRAHMILAKYRENIQNLQNLMNIKISNPASCLKNMYEALKLKGYSAELIQCMERISQEHTLSCTGYDIYWYLNEILYLYEEKIKQNVNKNFTLQMMIDGQETVAQTLFMDIASFDY